MGKTIEKKTVLTMEDTIARRNSIDGEKTVENFSISDCDEKLEEIAKEEIKGTQEYLDKYFPIVKASTLSLEDEFLKHRAQTDNQKKFKKMLKAAIKLGLEDFRAQRMDPSFDEEGNICYKAGMKPAVGKSAKWWDEKAKEFMPEKDSRLGITKKRIAFLGLLIKYLIEEKGYKVSDAWKAVCNQSKDLGHYYDSENAKHVFEPTGSRSIGGWYDLVNTCKITVDDEADGFSFVGGSYSEISICYPLADVNSVFDHHYDDFYSTGWVVMEV